MRRAICQNPHMASVKEFPKVAKKLGWKELGKRVWGEVSKDDVFTWGSALAYAWIFAIFPFLIFTLTLAPYLPGNVKAGAQNMIENAAARGLGANQDSPIVTSVKEVINQPQGGLLSFG